MILFGPIIRILLAGSILVACTEAKSTTDVVIMKNGDKLTGEIKRLENGFLYFKAGYMADTVQLDWNLVERLESKDEFNVVLTNGARETGVIEQTSLDPGEPSFHIRSDGTAVSARKAEVVTVAPVEDTFWRQLTGSVNYGLTFTSGTAATQSNLSGNVAYRSDRWAGQLEGSSVVSRQNGADSSGRNTLNLYYFNYRGTRWFVAGTATFLNSQQQDLTARTTLGAGIGWDVLRSSTTSLQLIGGVLFNNEKYSPASGSKSGRGADSQFLVQYTKYAFTKFQFTTQAGIFPSLTTPGRVRMSAESYLKRELYRNLNFIFSVYENYDNRPPVRAPKNDFGTTTSLGWTF